MDATQIHGKIYYGRGKVAAKLGLMCDAYRPAGADSPLTNKTVSLKASFNAGDNQYRNPNMPGDAYWHGDYDGRLTQPGDYLVRQSDGNVWYVAAQQFMLPIICVECNRTVAVLRKSATTGVGAVGYGGTTAANEVRVLGATTMWPASILFGGKTQQALNLPTSTKDNGWRVLLPPSVPITIRPSDILLDDLGRRYAVDGAELTDAGWRINAQEVHA